MTKFNYFLYCLFFGLFASFHGQSQHNHPGGDTAKAKNPFVISGVLSTYLSDPELLKYKMESSVITVAPKYTDTISHTHDGELFGYVMEGSVEIGLEHKGAHFI